MLLGDAQAAYLFQCGDWDLFAVLPDKAGTNIPRSSCTSGGVMLQEFKLGGMILCRQRSAPSQFLRSTIDKGHYIWLAGPLCCLRGPPVPLRTVRPAFDIRGRLSVRCFLNSPSKIATSAT